MLGVIPVMMMRRTLCKDGSANEIFIENKPKRVLKCTTMTRETRAQVSIFAILSLLRNLTLPVLPCIVDHPLIQASIHFFSRALDDR